MAATLTTPRPGPRARGGEEAPVSRPRGGYGLFVATLTTGHGTFTGYGWGPRGAQMAEGNARRKAQEGERR
jgi:hypothetical protein